MIRVLADENFHGDVVAGLLLRDPGFDLVRVQDAGLGGADDPAVLAWAADHDRIVLTHDKRTMPRFAGARLAAGGAMPGVFVVPDHPAVGPIIDELLLLNECSEHAEWAGRVIFLPLRRAETPSPDRP